MLIIVVGQDEFRVHFMVKANHEGHKEPENTCQNCNPEGGVKLRYYSAGNLITCATNFWLHNWKLHGLLK